MSHFLFSQYPCPTPKEFTEFLSGLKPDDFRNVVSDLPDTLFAEESFFSPSTGKILVSMTVGEKNTYFGSYAEKIRSIHG